MVFKRVRREDEVSSERVYGGVGPVEGGDCRD